MTRHAAGPTGPTGHLRPVAYIPLAIRGRLRLIVIAPALLLFVAGLTISPQFWTLLLLPLGMTLGWLPLLGGVRPEATECAFCQKNLQQLAGSKLLAGPSCSICAACAALSLQSALEAFLEKGDRLRAWMQLTDALPKQSPLALSGSVLNLVAEEALTAEQRLTARVSAHLLSNAAGEERLLRGIPEPQRTALDWSNLAVAVAEQGRFAEALALLDRAQKPAGTTDEALFLNNRAFFRLSMSPAPTLEERQSLLRDVERAIELIKTSGEEKTAFHESRFRGNQALVLLSLGENSRALKAAQEAVALRPLDAKACAVLARAHLALGETVEAQKALERALASCHPETLLARELLALRGQPNPSP